MKPFTISEIDIQIGEQLYFHIENIKYKPFIKGYISGRPEDCYEDEPSEVDFKDSDCKLMFKVSNNSTPEYFDCPQGLINCYFDFICEWVDEWYEEEKYKSMENFL